MKKNEIKKILFWSIIIIVSAIIYLKTVINGYHNYNESLITFRLCVAYLSHITMIFGIGKILWLLD